jgi:hypothetical protein
VFESLIHMLRLAGWLVALALAVLVAGFVVDQVKSQVASIGRVPGT